MYLYADYPLEDFQEDFQEARKEDGDGFEGEEREVTHIEREYPHWSPTRGVF